LMHAFRPDWWDLGHLEGPRSYMTILTIRALREATYVAARLRIVDAPMLRWETLAGGMERALTAKLWDDTTGYLTNYNGVAPDHHIYMGSLLAIAFGLLNSPNSDRLLKTATDTLLAPGLGIRTVMPADFEVDSVREYFHILDHEAGKPYVYINGGVWPHCNAWYAIGLQARERVDDAVRFMREEMTIDGIMKSPLGQPAMYEYRNSDPASLEYGKIDKPSFLWAGGFYLYTLYHLCGMQENEWNVSLGGKVSSSFTGAEFSLEHVGTKHVIRRGTGTRPSGILLGGKHLGSVVLPLSTPGTDTLTVDQGPVRTPYLESVNAILQDVRPSGDGKSIAFELSSFVGHRTEIHVRSAPGARSAEVDGTSIGVTNTRRSQDGSVETVLSFVASGPHQIVRVTF